MIPTFVTSLSSILNSSRQVIHLTDAKFKVGRKLGISEHKLTSVSFYVEEAIKAPIYRVLIMVPGDTLLISGHVVASIEFTPEAHTLMTIELPLPAVSSGGLSIVIEYARGSIDHQHYASFINSSGTTNNRDNAFVCYNSWLPVTGAYSSILPRFDSNYYESTLLNTPFLGTKLVANPGNVGTLVEMPFDADISGIVVDGVLTNTGTVVELVSGGTILRRGTTDITNLSGAEGVVIPFEPYPTQCGELLYAIIRTPGEIVTTRFITNDYRKALCSGLRSITSPASGIIIPTGLEIKWVYPYVDNMRLPLFPNLNIKG